MHTLKGAISNSILRSLLLILALALPATALGQSVNVVFQTTSGSPITNAGNTLSFDFYCEGFCETYVCSDDDPQSCSIPTLYGEHVVVGPPSGGSVSPNLVFVGFDDSNMVPGTSPSSCGDYNGTSESGPCGVVVGFNYTGTLIALYKPAASPPEAPTITSITGGDGKAIITFTPPTSNGGADITGYDVIGSPGGPAGVCRSSPCTITGLTNNTDYSFVMTATNSAGTSGPSNRSDVVTPGTVPDAPTITKVTPGDGQASIAFTLGSGVAAQAATSNSTRALSRLGGSLSTSATTDITQFTATSSPGGLSGTCTSSPCVVTGLSNGTTYTFTLTATNGYGTSASSAVSEAVTPVPGDGDSDGVIDSDDLCPNTPTGETVDANGCSVLQIDADNDGVLNDDDICPNTPIDEQADTEGCSDSQKDDDEDGITNDLDQCPNTPPNASVDDKGCSADEQDEDQDGVYDPLDQCPATPIDEEVDLDGCSDSQKDDDNDGITNDVDQCLDTPPDAEVDATGCAPSELDSDGDGVTDDLDTCPNTDPDLDISADGCSEVQQFENELETLPGLSDKERTLGARIDDICPALVEREQSTELTKGEKDLRDACSLLKNRETSEEDAVNALKKIALGEIASMRNNIIQLSASQFQNLAQRILQMNRGGGRGIQVSGLNISYGGKTFSPGALQSAFNELMGMGASEDGGNDSFADFGNLGLFVQGDIDMGDRDETDLETGYDFDSWNLSFGADYRLTDTFYFGGALSLGEVDVTYDDGEGSSGLENWAISGYGGWQVTDQWYFDVLLSYGETDYDMKRRVAYTVQDRAFDSSYQSATSGDQIFIGINTGYEFTKGSFRLSPIASFTYLDGSIDGYQESAIDGGSEAWAFQVDNQDYKSMRISVGGQADYILLTDWGVLIPGIRVSWVNELEDGGDGIALKFVNDPFGQDAKDGNIIIKTSGVDSSFFDASLNLSGQFPMGFSGYFSYKFYQGYSGYTQTGYAIGLRWDKSY